MSMFCFQCQETSKNQGCTIRGVCGKEPEVAALQDLLVWLLKGLSFYGVQARQKGISDPAADEFVAEALFTTITNANFDPQRFVALAQQAVALRDGLKAKLGAKATKVAPEMATWAPKKWDVGELVAKGMTVGVMADPKLNEDVRSLRELLTYGLKGLAAYAHHAYMLEHKNDAVLRILQEGLQCNPPVAGQRRLLDAERVRDDEVAKHPDGERQVEDGRAEAIKLITREASLRIARFACDYAVRLHRKKITAVHKANVLHLTDGLFLESARAAAAEYPCLEFDDRMVDATCYLLVKSPEVFDVLLLPNQYGDILSDLAAGLAGSLGLAPGANLGEGVAVFEAAHGAAPDLAGQGLANPIGLILSGALLLDHLGETEAAERVRNAVAAVLTEGRCLTPDLGGRATTGQLTGAICERMG